MDYAKKRRLLAKKIRNKDFFIAPGVFDMLSARIADCMNFEALYMTGYGAVASYLGLADAGLASYRDMVNRVNQIASGTSKPLIADADTGYGGLLNIAQTVKGYESAGACALHIEDQENPKKCGHTPGKNVVSQSEMVMRIKVAVDAKMDSDFLVIARTDSRAKEGLERACIRAEAYADAGADVLFVEGLLSVEEAKIVSERLSKYPLMINMADLGLTPIIDFKDLKNMGYSFAIYPGTAFGAAAAAIQSVYKTLETEGSSKLVKVPIIEGIEMHNLMGFSEVWDFEEKWGVNKIKMDEPGAGLRYKNNNTIREKNE